MLKPRLFLFVALLFGCSSTPFIVTSEQQENQLGNQAYRQVLAQTPASSDASWNVLVERVGKRIAAVANKPDFQWEFRLLKSPEKNAFCLPGGKVAVYTGIMPIANDEAGLAVILGHEVAHATLRHAGQRITLALGTELGMEGLQLLLGGSDTIKKKLLLAALGLGAHVGVTLPFSRAQEAQADEQGLIYTAEAGYDPRAAPPLWERMQQNTGGSPPTFLSDHPSSASREQALENEIPKVWALYESSPKHGFGVSID